MDHDRSYRNLRKRSDHRGIRLATAALLVGLALGGCLDWDSLYAPVCGDGTLSEPEACDDGNEQSGDGCSATCEVELGVCGNGIKEGNEECDDANQADDDGCLRCVLARCGDGQLWLGVEECDDGNQEDDDGCLHTCLRCERDDAIDDWDGHCYRRYDEAVRHPVAIESCAEWGGHLATWPERIEANQVCKGLMQDLGEVTYWVGAEDYVSDDTFIWASGEPLGQSWWASGQPESDAGCVIQSASAERQCAQEGVYDFTWRSAACHETHRYFCEKSPAVLRSTTAHAYRMFHEPLSWRDAVDACDAKGGHLATVQDADEAALLASMSGWLPTWIGGADLDKDGQASWVTNEPFEHDGFAPKQSPRFEDRLCLIMLRDGWHMRRCDNLNVYVCEFD